MPLLEQIVAEAPDRLPALEALAQVRERQGRMAEALALRQRIYGMRAPSAAELVRLGQLAMRPRRRRSPSSRSRRRAACRAAPSRTTSSSASCTSPRGASRRRETLSTASRRRTRRTPMALFKRAQVSVLLHEPDQAARIETARQRADATTRPLIARERLFQDAGAR